MAHHKRKRFIPRQAFGGLLMSIAAAWLLALLSAYWSADFWNAALLIAWLVIGCAIAVSVMRLIRRADDQPDPPVSG
jgi:hypothetical protein